MTVRPSLRPAIFLSYFVFLGYPAKKCVVGDVQAAQASSPHRVSDGQRRTRQLPKAKTRLSGSSVQQFVPATLFTCNALRPAYFAFSAMKIISGEPLGSNDPALQSPNTSRTTSLERMIKSTTCSRDGNRRVLSVVSVPLGVLYEVWNEINSPPCQ